MSLALYHLLDNCSSLVSKEKEKKKTLTFIAVTLSALTLLH